MDVKANVSILDIFRYDEYAIVWSRRTAESNEETNIGMTAFLHESPFPFKILGNIIFI